MINLIINPKKESWEQLLSRPQLGRDDLYGAVKSIIDNVKKRGDQALYEYSERFDNIELRQFNVTESELSKIKISKELIQAIDLAQKNIECFHKSQIGEESPITVVPGVKCWRKSVAIQNIGLYIPGGSAPLLSTALMLGIPARLANCKNIILCTPPNEKGEINPAILYVVKKLGINRIFKVGGAHAIAAMAFGTETIPKVDKIFGPGNQYVTEAKNQVQQSGVAIDMPAGPSEVLVIADKSCNPIFVAADLLSQAEHGPDSQVLVLSDTEDTLKRVIDQVIKQLEFLPRKDIAKVALTKSLAILLPSLDECMHMSNVYAPEHLLLQTSENDRLLDSIVNAGSVFVGRYSCESAGDYASGTNHTLPTGGYARMYSGLSVESFMKKISFQKIERDGLLKIGPVIEILAEAEKLMAHKNAVSVRLNEINNV